MTIELIGGKRHKRRKKNDPFRGLAKAGKIISRTASKVARNIVKNKQLFNTIANVAPFPLNIIAQESVKAVTQTDNRKKAHSVKRLSEHKSIQRIQPSMLKSQTEKSLINKINQAEGSEKAKLINDYAIIKNTPVSEFATLQESVKNSGDQVTYANLRQKEKESEIEDFYNNQNVRHH